MRCVLVCPPGAGLPPAVTARGPAVLLPLVDRPFLQHVIERLVVQGVDRIDLLVAEHPAAVEQLVGDGSRWGCRAEVHLLRDGARPYARLGLLGAVAEGGGVLLVHGDRLPGPLTGFPPAAEPSAPLLLRSGGDDAPTWTGWAWLPASTLAALPEHLDEAGLEAALQGCAGAASLVVPTVLSVASAAALLEANRAVLDGRFPGLLLTGREVEPGVWLSRNVVLHPSAEVVPPVHLCENVRVGAHTRLGPGAVIGRDSILDGRCRVEAAVVGPGSYVGEGLDLVGVLVDRNLLVSVEHGVATTVTDRFILGALKVRPRPGRATSLAHRALALLLLVFGAPPFLLAWLHRAFSRRPTVWNVLDAVALPAEADEATWRTVRLRALTPPEGPVARATFSDLLLRVVPLLPAVLLGRLGLVGLPPRSAAALRELPEDWRGVLLGAHLGVIWEAHVTGARSDDERRAAETYYAAVASLRHDLSVLLGYLRRVFACERRPGAGAGASRALP